MAKRYRVGSPPVEEALAHLSLGLNCYPQNADLLRVTLWALLQRIEQRDPHEAQLIKGLLRELAGLEIQRPWDADTQRTFHAFFDDKTETKMDFSTPEAIMKTCHDLRYTATLGRIAGRDPSQNILSRHDALTIARQQALIGNYLQQHRFDSINNNSTRRRWLLDHLPKLLDLMSVFSCPCLTTNVADRRQAAITTIQTRFQRQRDSSTPTLPLTPRTLIFLVLGAYHNETPDTLRKALGQQARDIRALVDARTT